MATEVAAAYQAIIDEVAELRTNPKEDRPGGG
jgi:hypothetical protein